MPVQGLDDVKRMSCQCYIHNDGKLKPYDLLGPSFQSSLNSCLTSRCSLHARLVWHHCAPKVTQAPDVRDVSVWPTMVMM